MGILFDAVVAFFEQDHFPIQRIGDETAASATVQGENGYWSCVAQVVEEDRLFLFYSASPLETPPEKRADMAEFIARANFGAPLGNFEMNYDFEGSDVRYKTTLNVLHVPDELLLESTWIQHLIGETVYANVSMMDRYLPGIRVLLEDNVPPATAIRLVED